MASTKPVRTPNRGRGVSVPERGFGTMILRDPEYHREIASKGGKTAHKLGVAHQWTSAEAKAAGRKGGLASHARRQAAQLEQQTRRAARMAPALDADAPTLEAVEADAQAIADAAGEGMITNHDN